MADTSNVTAPKQRLQDELQAVRKLCLSVNGLAPAPVLFIFDATVLGGLVVWNALLFCVMVQHDMTDFGKYRYKMFGHKDPKTGERLGGANHWFPGNNAADLYEPTLLTALSQSPFATRIPVILREAHEMLFGEPQKRLSDS